MDLGTLELFCEVVRSRSFSEGARARGLSQSAASQAVAQLEKEVGVALLDRATRPVALTPAGRTFYERVLGLLQDYEQLTAEIRSAGRAISGTVRVAAIYSIGLHALGSQIQRFRAQYPQARVRLEYLRPNAVVDAVVSERADLGVLSFPVATRVLEVIPLRTERMVFVCPPAHRLARCRRVAPQDLAGEDVIGFDRDLAIRRAIDRALRRRGVTVNVSMEFDNIENIKDAVESGAGVAVLPEPTVRKETALRTLVARPLAIPDLVRPIGILHRRRHLPPAVTRFIALLKSE